jgi:RNA-directed DNA polymerase
MRTLLNDVRSEQNIFSAWRHVKRSALSSLNDEIRGAASEFEHAHQRHLRRVIDQLREDRFQFDPVLGVLKDAKKRIAAGKDPRPIAVATLKNRVVQRAILQVLQPRITIDLREKNPRNEARSDVRLGKINDVNRSRFGVGGLIRPYGGVARAIEVIGSAIDNGAKFYYQSDIKAFFTKIPTERVVDFIRAETKEGAFVDLFARGLAVHLANPDELQGYAALFPQGGIGVAQGSSLSAFAGNVLLYDMDHQLNALGVTAVRYIDDVLMVAADEESLELAIKYAEKTLSSFGFGLYSPENGSDKAARGECKNSINFLGCCVQPNRCVPSAASFSGLRGGVTKSISESKTAIKKTLKSGKSLNSKLSRTGTLDTIGKRIYGWQKAFSFCTDGNPFEELDRFIDEQISSYESIVFRLLRGQEKHVQTMVMGVPSTHAMFLEDRRRRAP